MPSVASRPFAAKARKRHRAALAAGLARLLSDGAHRRDLVARGHEVAARHSWDTTAERVAALLRRVSGVT